MTQPAPARAVGVRDVAAHAGVSTQTVSRVLNGHPHIRPETRQRVLDAIQALGYRINNAARALGTSTSRTLGVLASDAALYGPAEGVAALEAAARAEGRWIATAYADASDVSAVEAAVGHLLAQGVDGIVLVGSHALTLETAKTVAAGVPIVALHGGTGTVAQSAGAALAVTHLLDLGHRRIAEVAGPGDWLEAIARSRGVAEALDAAGLAVAARWEGDWSAAAGYALAGDIVEALGRPDPPTALAVANDQMALGLMAGLHARGVEVPTVLSVVGFDDNPDSAFYLPALTTVRLDLASEARRVVAEVVGGSSTTNIETPRLVARRSTAPR
ncbi:MULTISPECIES: LacI family DNA-binding transcriptional regulator [unclassified Microbacterium]|uniref:LacI family DNA-binding transcriptional regulator n=1 Tax=unclassified Microbacterium TaxID=2609290 RepID=UPI000C2BAAC8|nr:MULTISPECIES: substrate-binding domain-containing protein [unclassified Microbacterium]